MASSKTKSTADAIFVMRQLRERYKKKKMYYIFVGLEKTFDGFERSDSMGSEKGDGS